MEPETLLSLKYKYNQFKSDLEIKITDTKVLLFNERCYLVEESWIDEFNKICDILSSRKSKDKYFKTINISLNMNVKFINDIPSFIKCLKENKKFKLIDVSIVESLSQNKNELTKNNYVKYYTGNNKMIFEFIDRTEKMAVLLENPLSYNKKIYFLELKENDRDNKNLFQAILSSEEDINTFSSNNHYKYIYKNISTVLNNFNAIHEEKCKQQKCTLLFKTDILKLFIYMFYYEKLLSNNNLKNINKEDENFYLIDAKWISKFKAALDYNIIESILNPYTEQNNSIQYEHLEL